MKKISVAWFPLALFVFLVIVLGIMLPRDRQQFEVTFVEGMLPDFNLPSLLDDTYYSQNDIFGEWLLVNVWASWCAPCRLEHPVLVSIAEEYDIPILGVNFRDKQNDALEWLEEHKNPFTWTLADYDGKLAFDWGIFGVPTTYLIAPDGSIAYQFAGILTTKIWQQEFLPILEANENG